MEFQHHWAWMAVGPVFSHVAVFLILPVVSIVLPGTLHQAPTRLSHIDAGCVPVVLDVCLFLPLLFTIALGASALVEDILLGTILSLLRLLLAWMAVFLATGTPLL